MILAPGTRSGTSATRTLTALLIATVLPVAALAQTAAPRRLFVDATSASGAAVPDLGAADFQVFVGGEPRAIASVTRTRRPESLQRAMRSAARSCV